MHVCAAADAGALPTSIVFSDGYARGAGADAGADEGGAAAAADENGARPGTMAFELDGVFAGGTTQRALFDALGAPAVASVLAGFNACVLAYGRSGSGKTHTVLGPTSLRRGDAAWSWAELDAERAAAPAAGGGGFESALGLVPRALAALLRGAGRGVTVRLAVAEVYNNRLFDLLREGGQAAAQAGQTTGDEPAAAGAAAEHARQEVSGDGTGGEGASDARAGETECCGERALCRGGLESAVAR
jgi:hypothetical protein